MDTAALAQVSAHLALGAFATFAAILLWSRTRDIAWTFLIVGTIVSWAGMVLSTLTALGIVDPNLLYYRGIPVLEIALEDVPPLCVGIGFLAAATRRRRP